MPELNPGETAEMKGSGKKPYTLRNIDGVYDCSCPAWRNQSHAIDLRTCKHLCKYLGNAAEEARVGFDHLPTAVKKKLGKTRGAGASADPAPKAKKAAKKPEPEKEVPALLLAHCWEDEDPSGMWLSEKLDGVRAKWTGAVFLSRAGNRFYAPAWFTAGLPAVPLDGELFIGRRLFQQTVSVVRRRNAGEAWKQVRFRVFDVPEHGGEFEARLLAITALIKNAPYAEAVPHTLCQESPDSLRARLKTVEAAGWEGLMLRAPESLYESCRSHTLLKVVSFKSAEATVTGYTKGRGKHKGVVGALMVLRSDGTTFKVGSGLSNEQRREPPPVGSTITYRYRELTQAGVPRFARLVGERIDAA